MARAMWAGCILASALLLVAAIRSGTSDAVAGAGAVEANTSAALKAPAASARGADAETFKLSGRVAGASGKNNVYVALWRADGFLTHPVQQHKIAAGADPVFEFEVPAGRWAVSSFEDRNGNGVLDMGMFGPKEPSGFWRPFNGHHKPRFEEVSSQVDKDVSNITVTLK